MSKNIGRLVPIIGNSATRPHNIIPVHRALFARRIKTRLFPKKLQTPQTALHHPSTRNLTFQNAQIQ
jgi:hypothetical protein